MKQKIEEAKVLLARAQARLVIALRKKEPDAIKAEVVKALEILGNGEETEWKSVETRT